MVPDKARDGVQPEPQQNLDTHIAETATASRPVTEGDPRG
jgi:hypothetical protein